MTRTDRLIAVVATEGGKYEPVPRLRVKARAYPTRIQASGASDCELLLKSRAAMLRFPVAYRYDVVWRRWIKRYVSRTMRPSGSGSV